MLREFRPEHAIVPIVRAFAERPIKELLGTGFFVGTDTTLHLVTAKHVIADNPLSGDEKYGIVFRGEKTISLVSTPQVRASLDYDLAVCSVSRSDFPQAIPLPIARSEAALTDDVFSFEYSSTRIERSASGHTNVSFQPHTHKGNIVRSYESTYPEKIKTPSILTSFPALQGASGAPVFAATRGRRSFGVVGMLVANVEQHLLPAQVVQIQDGSSYREKTSYFLPYGKGLARALIATCLEGMQIPFTYAEED